MVVQGQNGLVSAALGAHTAAVTVTAGVNVVQVPLLLYLGRGCLSPHAGRVVLAFEAAGVAAGGRTGSSAPADLLCWAFADQEERTKAIEAFRDGKKDVLVATDVASKGLDFPAIQHVINYDMPEEIENYGAERVRREGGCVGAGLCACPGARRGRGWPSRCLSPSLTLAAPLQFTASGAQAVQATPALPPPSSTKPAVRNGLGPGEPGGGLQPQAAGQSCPGFDEGNVPKHAGMSDGGEVRAPHVILGALWGRAPAGAASDPRLCPQMSRCSWT